MVHKNNYDIPAYKFGLVKYNSPYNCGSAIDENYWLKLWANTAISTATIIPFENLNGLKVSTVKALLNINGPFSFLCYVEYIDRAQITHQSIIHRMDFHPGHLDNKDHMTIDYIVENAYSSIYEDLGEHEEVANCYIQRYQSATYEDAKQKIYLLKRNGENNNT